MSWKVPTRPLSLGAMMVFEDTELHTLGNAFDRAWDRFLRTGRLTPDNFAQSREMIANAILEYARRGERDEWRLARHAIFHSSVCVN